MRRLLRNGSLMWYIMLSVLNLCVRVVSMPQKLIWFYFHGLSVFTCFDSHLILGRHVRLSQVPYLYTGTRACVRACREVQISEPSLRPVYDRAYIRVQLQFVTYFRLHTRILWSLRECPLWCNTQMFNEIFNHTELTVIAACLGFF